MSKTAFVLHSGGLDSTTCLAIAVDQYGRENVLSFSADYGQRHNKELRAAEEVCIYYGIPHTTMPIPNVPKTMLTDRSQSVPDISYADIKGISPTYVPFRNGLMLSALASHAQNYCKMRHLESDGAEDAEVMIFFGAHAEDAAGWAYPDCTPEFIGAMANAIFIGTYQKVRLEAPLTYLKKHEIIKLGYELSAPYHLTWSCYKGELLHCGTCPTCRARKEGFKHAGIKDPTQYAI